jgi:hypothetical protein
VLSCRRRCVLGCWCPASPAGKTAAMLRCMGGCMLDCCCPAGPAGRTAAPDTADGEYCSADSAGRAGLTGLYPDTTQGAAKHPDAAASAAAAVARPATACTAGSVTPRPAPAVLTLLQYTPASTPLSATVGHQSPPDATTLPPSLPALPPPLRSVSAAETGCRNPLAAAVPAALAAPAGCWSNPAGAAELGCCCSTAGIADRKPLRLPCCFSTRAALHCLPPKLPWRFIPANRTAVVLPCGLSPAALASALLSTPVTSPSGCCACCCCCWCCSC